MKNWVQFVSFKYNMTMFNQTSLEAPVLLYTYKGLQGSCWPFFPHKSFRKFMDGSCSKEQNLFLIKFVTFFERKYFLNILHSKWLAQFTNLWVFWVQLPKVILEQTLQLFYFSVIFQKLLFLFHNMLSTILLILGCSEFFVQFLQ